MICCSIKVLEQLEKLLTITALKRRLVKSETELILFINNVKIKYWKNFKTDQFVCEILNSYSEGCCCQHLEKDYCRSIVIKKINNNTSVIHLTTICKDIA